MASPREVELNDDQQRAVAFAGKHQLIRGAPGSGKTLVLLARARHLAQSSAGAGTAVRIFTYNRTLAAFGQQQAQQNGMGGRVVVQTFHSWAYQLLSGLGARLDVIGDRQRQAVVEQLVEAARPQFMRFKSLDGRDTEWWMDEFDWIKGQLVRDEDGYRGAVRIGRGSALADGPRRAVWDVFGRYQAELDRRGLSDYQDFALRLLERVDPMPDQFKVDHVLIDEAQDLHYAQLKLLTQLARHSLTIAADQYQKIYKTTFRWADLGVDVVGRGRTRTLPGSYRSTRQILALAAGLRAHDTLVRPDDEEYLAAVESRRDGPLPVVFAAGDAEREDAAVCHLARHLRQSRPAGTVGVLARSWEVLARVARALAANGLAFEYVRRDEGGVAHPGVKLTTFHSAKGLEFDDVVLASVNAGLVPPPYRGGSDGGDGADGAQDREEFLGVERRLLYVAMTRAKHGLYLLHGSRPSPFLEELDAGCYRTAAPELEAIGVGVPVRATPPGWVDDIPF